MPSNAPLAVCIPYYTGLDMLRQCLRHLQADGPALDQIVVLQNGSPEPCEAMLAREYPHVHCVVAPRNVGFAAAVNEAIRHTRAEAILLLNPDTFVHTGAVSALQRSLHSDPSIAAVGPMLLNTDGTFQAQCRRGRLTPSRGLAYALGLDRRWPDDPRFAGYLLPSQPATTGGDVEAISGASMLLRRSALEANGGFDERMFLYGEDLDLCYRLREHGFRVVYEPSARVTHVGGEGGTKRAFLIAAYHYHRSLCLLFRRHQPNRFYRLYEPLVVAGLWARFALIVAARPFGRRDVSSLKRRGADVTLETLP